MIAYKLVPVEPTPEMLEAGADWCGQGLGTYEAKGRAATAYKFMLAAAPEAQVEPVAWIRKWALDGVKPTKECNKNGRMAYPMKYKLHEVTRNRCLPDDVALYTAPQPAPGVTQPVRYEAYEALQAECEKLRKDAERYQWLRGNGSFAPSAFGGGWALACGLSRYSSVELDASVDSAMKAAEHHPECGCCGQTDRCDDDCDAVVIGGHRAAEQKPSVDDSPTPVSDELFAAEFNAWWEQYGQFCRAGGGDYERTFAFEAWRHLYPQLMELQMAAEEEQPVIPNEHGKNRYGLDMSYFRNLFNRELNRPLVDFKPSELARVLARASRTADPKVMHETEFQIAEQKPAPDVPALVEALEQVIKAAPWRQGPLWERSEQIVKARAALAAYHKGGDV